MHILFVARIHNSVPNLTKLQIKLALLVEIRSGDKKKKPEQL